MLRIETPLLLVALLLAGCGGERQPASDAPPAQVPELPKTGGCHNENLTGICKYAGMTAEPPVGGDLPGTTVFRIHHFFDVAGEDRVLDLTSYYLLIPDEKHAELEAFFRSTEAVDCTAYVIHPPCNPQGTSVSLALDLPPFAQVVRR